MQSERPNAGSEFSDVNQPLAYRRMVPICAILHGDVPRHLLFDQNEHPVALQLGGCDPDKLAECAEIGESFG